MYNKFFVFFTIYLVIFFCLKKRIYIFSTASPEPTRSSHNVSPRRRSARVLAAVVRGRHGSGGARCVGGEGSWRHGVMASWVGTNQLRVESPCLWWF